MTGSHKFGMHLIRCGTAAAACALLSACASMSSDGSTRAATARALGLKPNDLIIVSRSYEETGPAPADMALANYTVETRDGATYVCDLPAGSKAAAPDAPICTRKPRR